MTNFLEQDTSPRTTSAISLIALLAFFPLMLLGAYNAFSIVIRASGKPADIAVNTKSLLEPIETTFYHAFAQGGEESTDMLAPVVNEVKALKPRLIRLDHIYDHYNVVGKSGSELTFNFTSLDAAVNTIQATGAKPVLVLSYMPSVIARDGSVINPPNNWDEWSLVVQKTIERYSGRGQKNISGVYYEVWNEPDLPQFGSWKLTGEKNYLTLYQYASKGARNAQNVQQFFLGGPATTGLYKNWITSLIRSGNRVDFLSWHSYLADPKRYNDDQRNLTSWLLPYPSFTLIPKLITEYGFTGSKSNLYGTNYAAAHAAAVIRQVISGRPTYMFSFQLKDGPSQESGDGWGLLTHESAGKRAKPRYYVYNFLDLMAGTRLELTGEGSWVTGFASTREGVIRILLVNFDRSGSHTENVPVTFTNLDAGNYVYRELFLNGRDVKFNVSASEGNVAREVFMPAQSVAILELTKE